MTSKNFSSNQKNSSQKISSQNSNTNQKAKGIFDLGFIFATLKRLAWLPTLAMVGFFFVLPLASSMYLGNTTYPTVDAKFSTFIELTSLETAWTAMIAMVGAVMAGLSVFAYLQNRKQIDFFHSMPISREKFFLTNLIVGILVYLVPYLVGHLMNVVVLFAYGLGEVFSVTNYVTSMVEVTLVYLAVFGATVLGVMLTGNRFGSLKFTGFVLFVPALAIGIWYALHAAYYDTYIMELTGFEKSIVYSSPVIRYFVSFDSDWFLNLRSYIYFALYAVLTLAVAFVLYKKRPSEAAGRTLAFPRIKPFVKYPLVLLVGIGGGIFFDEVAYNENIWIYIGAVLTTFLLAQTLEILFESDFKAIKNALLPALLTAVLACGTLFVFSNDVFGYDEYLPEASEVKSVNIDLSRIVDIEEGISRLDYPYGSVYNYTEAMLEKVELTDETTIAAALALGQNYVDGMAEDYHHDPEKEAYYDTKDYDYPVTAQSNSGSVVTITDSQYAYDYDAMKMVSSDYGYGYTFSIDVTYNLNNGKEVTRRYYYLPFEPNMANIITILDSQAFKDSLAIQRMDSSLCTIRSCENAFDDGVSLDMNYEEQAKLVEIYRKELKEMTGEELIYGVRIGEMGIRTFNNEQEMKDYQKFINSDEYSYRDDYSFSNIYPIYALMDETLAYMEAHGGDFDLQGKLMGVEKQVETEMDTYYEPMNLSQAEMYELFNKTIGNRSLMIGIGEYQTRYNFIYNNGDYEDSVARYLLGE